MITPQVSKNCQLTDSFTLGVQVAVTLWQTTQIISGEKLLLLTPAEIKPKSSDFFMIFFQPGADDLLYRVYVRAWTLCCYHSLIISQTFRKALTASVQHGQMRGDKECPFGGVSSCGRVWWKGAGNDAGSAGKRRSELHTDHNEPLYRAASENYFQLARYCAFNFRDNYRFHGLVRFLPV